MNWKEYQEEAAEFFRTLGLEAQTNVKVQGTRTHHDIDVLVKSHHVGFEITWIVECKKRKKRISKLHVLALREIVNDIGADRGILLSESGFQSGAFEAANLTNVQITSLSEARIKSEHDINAMRLLDLYDRTEETERRYWDISKSTRIEHSLRQDPGQDGYSGNRVLSTVKELLNEGLRGKYPFNVDAMSAFDQPQIPATITSSGQLIEIIDPMITDLASRLNNATQS